MRAEQIPLDFNKTSEEDKTEYDLPFDDEAQPNSLADHNWKGVNMHKHKWTVNTQQKKKPGEK
jgi:hypothetical protein